MEWSALLQGVCLQGSRLLWVYRSTCYGRICQGDILKLKLETKLLKNERTIR